MNAHSEYDTVYIKAGYYEISDTVVFYSDMTLRGAGADKTIIRLVDECGLPQYQGLFEPASHGAHNFRIHDFQIDGNYFEQTYVKTVYGEPAIHGRSFMDGISFRHNSPNGDLSDPYDLEIFNMKIHHIANDGIKINGNGKPANIDIHDNEFYWTGHDDIYIYGSDGVHIHDNLISVLNGDCGFRVENTDNVVITNNVLQTDPKALHGLSGIYLSLTESRYTCQNYEVSYNEIKTHQEFGVVVCNRATGTPALDLASDLNIHHNLIYDSTGYGPYSGGIQINGWDNVVIENNVIDSSEGDGIITRNRFGMGDTTGYRIYVRDNIIVGTDYNSDFSSSGHGVNNYLDSSHDIILDNNCVWDNEKGNYINTGSYSSDFNVDPMFVDRVNHDYRLRSDSPIYGAGIGFYDDSDHSSTSPEPANTAPFLSPIGSMTVDEGSILSFTVSASDEDGDSLVYSATGLPVGATIDAASGMFSWTPSDGQAGTYDVTFGVTDGELTDSETVTINVDPVARAPVLDTVGDMTVTEGTTLSFITTASDADGDTLTYSATGLPVGATFDAASGEFSWTPADDQAGTYDVTFGVTDGQFTDSETITITVDADTPSETMPEAMHVNRLRESTPDSTLEGTSYVDVGNLNGVGSYREVMWFDLSMYNETDSVTSATLSLSWYYPQNSPRNHDTVVEVYRAADWDPEHVSWNEKASGVPWTNAGGDWFDSNDVAQGSTPYETITFSASDVPDNGRYELDVTELVQGYVSGEHANTGFFIKASNEDDNYIAFYGSDSGNAGQQVELTVTHSPSEINVAPVMDPIADVGVYEGNTAGFTVSASDEDGDGLIYSATGLPAGASLDADSGAFTWIPSIGQAGTYDIMFEVSDGQLADSEMMTIVVDPQDLSTNMLETTYANRLRESTPETTLEGDSYIDVGNLNGVGSYREVMWFDLSMYNETDSVTSATLSMSWYYPQNSPRNHDTVVEVYRAADWDPEHVSWNGKASGTSWNNAGGDWYDSNDVAQGSTPYASITFNGSDVPDNGVYEFDVTELVQDYVSGEHENTGFFIKARDEHDNYIAFDGTDALRGLQQPMLTVNYYGQ